MTALKFKDLLIDENTSKKGKCWANVITCYEPREDDELSLEVNEQIEVTDQSQQWWWEGIAKGKKGMFPSNYVMLLPEKLLPEEEETEQHNNETPVGAQLMYNYDAAEAEEPTLKGTSENSTQNKKVLAKVVFHHTPQSDAELLLVEDHIIEITSQLDPWWWKGIVQCKKGHFPSHCVVLLPADEEEKETKQQDYAPPVKARVKYDYDAFGPHELTLKVGDIITDISTVEYGWWEGILNGKRGMFPCNFVDVHTGTSSNSIPNTKAPAKVIRNHLPQGEDELFLVKDDIIQITRQLDPLWWEGIAKGEKGYFPSYCVGLLQKDDKREKTKEQEYAVPEAYSWPEQSIVDAEAVISREGGKLCISNTGVKLYVPPNAFEDDLDQRLLQMRIVLPGTFDEPATSFTSNTSTVVELLPNNLKLKQTVILTLPHCLDLEVDRGDGSYTAKIFISHHEKGTSPVWEAKSNLLYYLDDTKCIIWLDSFCWVKFEVNGAIVKGKKIEVFAAGKILEANDNIVETEIGYFPDLPSGGEILRNNKDLILSQQKPFLFLKKTKLPLTLSLSTVTPLTWKPLHDLREIPYESIANSVEHSCPFIFQNESQLSQIPVCIYWISQGRRGVELTMRPKALPTALSNQSQEKNREPEDRMLDCFLFLKGKLIREWKDFGRYLRLSEDEISRVSCENKDDVKECIYQMLLTWQRIYGPRATSEK